MTSLTREWALYRSTLSVWVSMRMYARVCEWVRACMCEWVRRRRCDTNSTINRCFRVLANVELTKTSTLIDLGHLHLLSLCLLNQDSTLDLYTVVMSCYVDFNVFRMWWWSMVMWSSIASWLSLLGCWYWPWKANFVQAKECWGEF